jgi:hypothetical protein
MDKLLSTIVYDNYFYHNLKESQSLQDTNPRLEAYEFDSYLVYVLYVFLGMILEGEWARQDFRARVYSGLLPRSRTEGRTCPEVADNGL